MAAELELVLRAFLELIKLLKKDKIKKFKKAWRKDEKKFLKALAEGDVNTINLLFSKYLDML